MAAETKHGKARRLLADGKLTIRRVAEEAARTRVVATVRGDHGDYDVGFDPWTQKWSCSCASPKLCSHLIALKLVVVLNYEEERDA